MESPTNRIKEVLIEKGIKQTWLAEKLGKSFTIVNSYVCNRRQPSLELLFQIAEILQVNPKELINTPEMSNFIMVEHKNLFVFSTTVKLGRCGTTHTISGGSLY